MIFILLALDLLITLIFWINAGFQYSIHGGYAMFSYRSASFWTMLPYWLHLAQVPVRWLLFFLGWRFMSRLARRLHRPQLGRTAAALFISILAFIPLLVLTNIVDLLFPYMPFPGPWGSPPGWIRALHILHEIAYWMDFALMFGFTGFWIAVAALFHRLAPARTGL